MPISNSGLNYMNRWYIYLLSILFITSCSQEKEIVPEVYKPRNDHEAYQYSLKQAGLLNSALGIEWEKAAKAAMDKPLKVGTPFAEDFFFDPSQANALGYRFSALRGNKVEISVEIDAADSLDIFLDVFRIDNDSLGQFTHVASAASELCNL